MLKFEAHYDGEILQKKKYIGEKVFILDKV